MVWLWYLVACLVVAVIVGTVVWRSAPSFLERRARRVDLLLPTELRDSQVRVERAQSMVRALAVTAAVAGAFAVDARWLQTPAQAALGNVAVGLVLLGGISGALAVLRPRRRGDSLAHPRRWLTAFLQPRRLAALCGVGVWPLVVVSAVIAMGGTVRARQALAALAIACLAWTVLVVIFGWARLPLRGDTMTALGWADVRRAQELTTLIAGPGISLLFAGMALVVPMVDAASTGDQDFIAYLLAVGVTVFLGIMSFAAPNQRESRRWRSLFDRPVTVVAPVVPGREDSVVEAAS